MKPDLEQRVGNSKRQADKSKMSGGERFIAGILDKEGMDYKYEPRLCTEKTYDTRMGKKSYLKLYYPDFSVGGYGFMIEYIGMPDNSKYMAGLKEKKLVYQEMGIPVLYIDRDDIYEQKGKDWKLKNNAHDIVRWKILYMAQQTRSQGTEETSINADKFKDYEYKTAA